MTQNTEVTVKLTPITFIDRDNAKWTVDEADFEGQPVLRLSVKEESGTTEQVVFHKEDAQFISWLIEQAAK